MIKLSNLTLFFLIILFFNISGCDSNTESAITNKSWGAATILNESSAESLQIDIDKNDNIIAVWEDYSNESLTLNAMTSRFTRDSGWSSKVSIEDNDTHHAYKPKIAFDNNGNAITVWHQTVETEINSFALYSIWVNHYTLDSGWGIPQLIESDETGPAYSPDIAFDADGNAIVVWAQSDGIHFSMWANHYAKDNGWGIAELIETSDTGDALIASVNVHFDNKGNAIAVWSQSDSVNNNIMANRYTPDQGWGSAVLIETIDEGDAYSPQIAFDTNGNAMAVWSQSDGNVFSIWSNQYIINSGWQEPRQIDFDDTGNASRPRISIDKNNIAVVVWSQIINGSGSVWSNRYSSDSGWGETIPIGNNNSGGFAYSPEIAVNGAGSVVVVWQEPSISNSINSQNVSTYTANVRKLSFPPNNIWANNYNVNSGWGAASIIDDNNVTHHGSISQVVINSEGNAVAVWQSSSKLWWNTFE